MISRRHVAFVVATWVITRLICAALFEPWAKFSEGDAAYYLEVARSIAESGSHAFKGEPTLYRPPGYPIFLAALLPALPWAAWTLQSLVTLAASLFSLSRLPGRLGLVTALLVVGSPFLVVFEWALAAESLSVALIWTAWLFLATDKRRPVIAGLLIGVAALLRETALILPLLAIPIAVWFDRRIAKQLLITFVAACMVTVPWQIRNASLPGGTYALSDGRLGFNLWIGTWERNGDWYLAGLDAANYPENAFRSSEERTRLMAAYWAGNDRPFRDVALDRWQTDPRGTAAAWVTRYPRLWLGTRTDQIEFRAARGSAFWTALKSGLWVLNSLMLFAGFVGFLLAASRRSSQLVFALPIASLAALYLPFHNVETRYSLPALPFVYLFVAYLIVCWRMAPIKQEQESSSATL